MPGNMTRAGAVLLVTFILGHAAHALAAPAASCNGEVAAHPAVTPKPSGFRVAEGRNCMDRCMARCRSNSDNRTQFQICARQCVVSCGR